jgi:hypothetical protein
METWMVMDLPVKFCGNWSSCYTRRGLMACHVFNGHFPECQPRQLFISWPPSRAGRGYPGAVYVSQSIRVLTITPSGGDAILAWPELSATTGFALEQNSNLAKTNWLGVTNSPGVRNGQYQLVIPLSLPGDRFFRLKAP